MHQNQKVTYTLQWCFRCHSIACLHLLPYTHHHSDHIFIISHWSVTISRADPYPLLLYIHISKASNLCPLSVSVHASISAAYTVRQTLNQIGLLQFIILIFSSRFSLPANSFLLSMNEYFAVLILLLRIFFHNIRHLISIKLPISIWWSDLAHLFNHGSTVDTQQSRWPWGFSTYYFPFPFRYAHHFGLFHINLHSKLSWIWISKESVSSLYQSHGLYNV